MRAILLIFAISFSAIAFGQCRDFTWQNYSYMDSGFDMFMPFKIKFTEKIITFEPPEGETDKPEDQKIIAKNCDWKKGKLIFRVETEDGSEKTYNIDLNKSPQMISLKIGKQEGYLILKGKIE